MKWLFPLFMFCSSIAASAQTVAGLWRGRFTSNRPLQAMLDYKYELLLFQEGTKITGYSYSTMVNGTFYAVCEISGNLFDGYLVVTEKKTLYQNPPGPEGTLQTHILFINADVTEISGDWKQANKRQTQLLEESGKTFLKKEDDPTKSGLIKVLEQKNTVQIATPEEKPKPTSVLNKDSIRLSSRAVEVVQTIELKTDSVSFELYDDGLVDGDSVSVYVNNSILLNRVAVSDKGIKQTVFVPSTDDGLLITFFAENEGSVPPNTGMLIIYTAEKKYEIRFRSDNKKSAAIRILKK
ncbi:MAG: hypothetical protein GXC73_06520 [Chitinophagaceae bacterium]|nr:hypothetical protein [Chitinophagaceae bacterium]